MRIQTADFSEGYLIVTDYQRGLIFPIQPVPKLCIGNFPNIPFKEGKQRGGDGMAKCLRALSLYSDLVILLFGSTTNLEEIT